MPKNKEPEIRKDLGNAVLDYSSKKRYVWTGESAEPRSGADLGDAAVMPTVTKKEFRAPKTRVFGSLLKRTESN